MSNLSTSKSGRYAVPDNWIGIGKHIRSFATEGLYVSLAVVFLWIGFLKFTAYEAEGIASLVMNNPLLSWVYGLFGVQGGSDIIGLFEIAAGVLLLAGLLKPEAAALGALMATMTLLATLSCLFTTPGVTAPEAGGFPVLSADVGQFLLKDLGLLAIALYALGDSLARPSRR